tara:strand:- start:261 stop:551 length:291 start_codon:yes stop_codon:yes gene_type:complete
MTKKTNDYIDEVVENIRKDREVTKELLQDAIKWLSKDESRHREIGIVMAKYVETLQRSNEQLVKVVSMMSKKQKDSGLSSEEMKNIFDMISEGDDG